MEITKIDININKVIIGTGWNINKDIKGLNTDLDLVVLLLNNSCFLQEKNAQSCKEKYTILQEKVHKKCVFFY